MPENMQFMKVKHITVTEQVSKQIQDMITSGQFKPGDKLPTQKELEQMMGVSRPTLREAISRLISSGAIEARQGQGYYVKEPNLKINISAQLIQYDYHKVRDIFEARLFLVSTLSQLAAVFATDEELEKLAEDCRKIEEGTFPLDEVPYGENHIHALIAEYSHNNLLAEFERSILDLLTEYPDLFVSLKNDTYQEEYETRPHHLIVEAICRRDPVGAYNEALRHMLHYMNDIGMEKKYDFSLLKRGAHFLKKIDKLDKVIPGKENT